MVRRFRALNLAICVLVLAAAAAAAQEKGGPEGDAPGPAKPDTFVLERAPFKIVVDAKGVFESAEISGVSIEPEAWTTFRVLEAVEQGVQVKKGDTLVSFDTRKIEEEIRDLQAGRELSQADAALKRTELDSLQYFQPLDLEAAERAKRIADEDLARFTEIDRAMSEKRAHQSKKSAAYRLENAQEELKQLEQMYKEDDLTEETEEIVLKRAQRAVESATFFLEVAETSAQQTLEVELPRRAEQLETQARRRTLDLEKVEATFPLELTKKRLELEKLAYDLKKKEEQLKKLQADLEGMVVLSPADGVVYYGQWANGRWSGGEEAANKLRPGGTVSPHSVFISIVKPRPVTVRLGLPEESLRYLSAGVAAKVVPTAYPDIKIHGELARISPVPVRSGTFDAAVEVELGEEAEALMPGMACSVKLISHFDPNALTIPRTAAFADEVDEEKTYVYVVTGEGGHEKRPVVLGKYGEENVEVLEGLKEGDEILLEEPE